MLWLLMLAWKPEDLTLWTVFQKLSSALGVVFIITVCFKKWAWRWGIFKGWLVLVENLTGEYEGIITPSQSNTTFLSQPKKITATIKQSLFTFDIKVISDESESNSFSHSFIKEQNGDVKVVYSYSGKPRINNRQKNPIHEGTSILNLIGKPTTKLKGEYWTSRGTIGEIELTKK